jgi:hypothetical protein
MHSVVFQNHDGAPIAMLGLSAPVAVQSPGNLSTSASLGCHLRNTIPI